jgi:IS5 family transposase
MLVGRRKNKQKYYGYKDHTKTDVKNKLIDTYKVTSAEIHDSQPVEELLSESDKGQKLYADSAYFGEKIDTLLRRKQIDPQIIERAFNGKPLTNEQKNIQSRKIKNTLPLRTRFWLRNQQYGRFLHKIHRFSACKRRYRANKSRLQYVSLRTNCTTKPSANKEIITKITQIKVLINR